MAPPPFTQRLRTYDSPRNRLIFLAIVLFLAGFLVRGCYEPGDTRHTPDAKPGDASAEAAAEPTVWTCSMHPQIQAPRPGLCPICAMDLIPLTDDAALGPRMFATSPEAAALMNIQSMPVQRKFVEATIRLVGKVDYAETRLSYITAWVPGRLEELYVDYTGIRVNRGDHMVLLYSPQLISGQEELRQARRTHDTLAEGSARQMARATLEAARERLRLWGLTPEQITQAETGQFADQVTIYAPVGGTVIDRQGTVGQYVDTGTQIYTLADMSEMWVLLDAYESDLQWLRYGQAVEFTTEAHPGEPFEGTISFIPPFLDPRTRTVKVRVNVPNPEGKLKPEMFVRAVVQSRVAEGGRVMDPALAGKLICPMHPEIVREEQEPCPICGMDLVPVEEVGYIPVAEQDEAMPLVIPASAPLITGTRAVVYVEVPGMEQPTFEGREIVLGPRAGDYYIVRSGLAEGDAVVVNGNFKIDSALQIMAKRSMMAADAPLPGTEDLAEVPLPLAAREQLQPLLSAHDRLVEARARSDRGETREALEALEQALDTVELEVLPHEMHLVWEEYHHRLKNDIAEARYATSEHHVARVWDKLHENMRTLIDYLNLKEAPELRFDVPEVFQAQLRTLYDAYLGVQTALADDELASAQEAAALTAQALAAVDMALDTPAHDAWMPQATEMDEALEALHVADTLEEARIPFEPLSEALAQAIRAFGIAEGVPVYWAYCPMAFDNRGAYWLQQGTEITNAYFGAAMFRCGEVVDRLDDAEPEPEPAAPPPEAALEAPAAFQAQLRGAFESYLHLQQALAGDDAGAALASVAPIAESVTQLDDDLPDETARAVWTPLHAALEEAVASLQAADDIELLRVAFEPLSDNLAEAITRFGIAEGAPVYRVHCPMAFDDEGADWLANEEEVLNPYFGALMLRCGFVVEQIHAGAGAGA